MGPGGMWHGAVNPSFRVRGLIYDGVGNAGMSVWAQAQVFREMFSMDLSIWAQEKQFKIQIQWFQWL